MSELKTNLCDGCTLWPCGAHAPIGVDGHIVTECANRKPTSGAAIATLKAQRDELLVTLNKLRRDHATCEDNWYSCPKSGECLNTDDGDRCTCGADEHNAIIDAAIANAEATK